MSLDELFCGIKTIGRFSEESCEALQIKGNMQQQNTKVVTSVQEIVAYEDCRCVRLTNGTLIPEKSCWIYMSGLV